MQTLSTMTPSLGLRQAIEKLAGTDIENISAAKRIEFARQLVQDSATSSPQRDLRLPQRDNVRQKRQLAKLRNELSGYRSAIADLPPAFRLAARSKISSLEEKIAVMESVA